MELNLLLELQNLRTALLDIFFVHFTALGNHGELWIGLCVFLMIFKRTRKVAFVALILLAIEYILVDYGIKLLFARPRPFMEYPMELLIKTPSGYSFPSGHTASSFTVAGFLFMNKVKGRWIILLLAVLMAFSRLYLFVHYPSDILAGLVLGLLIAFAGYRIMKAFERRQ